jgi:hypothetical protein
MPMSMTDSYSATVVAWIDLLQSLLYYDYDRAAELRRSAECEDEWIGAVH